MHTLNFLHIQSYKTHLFHIFPFSDTEKKMQVTSLLKFSKWNLKPLEDGPVTPDEAMEIRELSRCIS